MLRVKGIAMEGIVGKDIPKFGFHRSHSVMRGVGAYKRPNISEVGVDSW